MRKLLAWQIRNKHKKHACQSVHKVSVFLLEQNRRCESEIIGLTHCLFNKRPESLGIGQMCTTRGREAQFEH